MSFPRCPLWFIAGLFLVGCSTQDRATRPTAVFQPEPPPVFKAEGLRLAILNTEFLFDGLDDEGGADFPHKGDPVKARAHRDRIGEILRLLDADLIVLAEIESREVLQQLIATSLPGLGYRSYFVQGQDTFTGQDVGLLSRVPVDTTGRTDEQVKVAGEQRAQGVSKNLFARLSVGGVPLTLIGLHFYARPLDPTRKARREAQAEVIRRLVVRELTAGRAVAVLGDFNDYDDRTPDRNGNRPVTDVLRRIKAAGPGPEDDLHNVIADVPQADRFTNHFDRNHNRQVEWRELSAIDHLLLSPGLYRRLREVHYVQAYDPLTYTDHFPVVVTLDLDAPAHREVSE